MDIQSTIHQVWPWDPLVPGEHDDILTCRPKKSPSFSGLMAGKKDAEKVSQQLMQAFFADLTDLLEPSMSSILLME